MQANGSNLNPAFILPHMAAGRPAQRPRSPFGERLAAAREQAGLTQAQLAEKLGTSQAVIAQWERRAVTLRPEQLVATAGILDVSTDYLLGRADADSINRKGPPGKLRIAFEEARGLSRHHQNKLLEFVEAYVRAFQKKAS